MNYIEKCQELNAKFDGMREFGDRGETVFQAHIDVSYCGETSIILLQTTYDKDGMNTGDYGQFEFIGNAESEEEITKILQDVDQRYAKLQALWEKQTEE